MTVRNAVEKAEKPGPGALVKQYESDFSLVLPSHIKVDQWVRVAQGVLRRDPKLAKAALANPGSFLSAMLRCAHLGLEPGETYHLVAFGNEVTGITDYKGEIELIYRAGEVVKVEAQVVHDNDQFDYRPGEMDRPIHSPNWFGDRGEMVGAYAYGVMRSGAVSRVVVMGREEIEKHRAVSRSANAKDSPWQKWEPAMWLKTVVKQLRNWVPSSAEYRSEMLRSEARATDVGEALPFPVDTLNGDDVIDGEVVEDPPAEVDANGELPVAEGA